MHTSDTVVDVSYQKRRGGNANYVCLRPAISPSISPWGPHPTVAKSVLLVTKLRL